MIINQFNKIYCFTGFRGNTVIVEYMQYNEDDFRFQFYSYKAYKQHGYI